MTLRTRTFCSIPLLACLAVAAITSISCSKKNRTSEPKLVQIWTDPLVKQIHIKKYFESQWEVIYEQGWCHRNIRDFMGFLARNNVDISDARALVIFKKNDDSFLPMNSRNVVIKPWYFHVVMELNAEIYDFDFMTIPTVLPSKQYFKKIFGATSPRTGFVFKRFTFDQFRNLPNSFFMEYSRFEHATLDFEWFEFNPVNLGKLIDTPIIP